MTLPLCAIRNWQIAATAPLRAKVLGVLRSRMAVFIFRKSYPTVWSEPNQPPADLPPQSVIITTAAAATAIPKPCRRVGRSRNIHAASRIVDAG